MQKESGHDNPLIREVDNAVLRVGATHVGESSIRIMLTCISKRCCPQIKSPKTLHYSQTNYKLPKGPARPFIIGLFLSLQVHLSSRHTVHYFSYSNTQLSLPPSLISMPFPMSLWPGIISFYFQYLLLLSLFLTSTYLLLNWIQFYPMCSHSTQNFTHWSIITL